MTRYYVVEVVREADKKCFMLCGFPSDDPDDTWHFQDAFSTDDRDWHKLKTITRFHNHRDHNQWICDFVIPKMQHILEDWPCSKAAREKGGVQPHTLTVFLVDEKLSLNLRYKPMLCKTFHLSGEPFKGATKQGYYNG